MKHFMIAATALVSTAGVAHAVTTYNSLSAWKAAIGTYAETTNYGVSDGTAVTGFTTTDGVAVGVVADAYSIGDGWNTWSGGYTGQVLTDTSSFSVPFTVGPTTGFGFFAEPDDSLSLHDITMTTSDGSSLTETVDGMGGASFFGWTGTGITSFTLSSDNDFATGDFFSAAVVAATAPEPASWTLMLLGFGALGGSIRTSRKRAIAA